ncbi:hypothetical protein GQ44DRAFT_620466 [Phaeosphaeriaceae sp. PMI808]|nr:hypothetical protein GQ44DRAFT_620466 [Phaeosphaeriaceae sp. PMI808]
MLLPFNQESWIWYTCAVGIIFGRLISRKIHLRSIRSLQVDDWIMGLFVTIAYTALIVCSNRYVKAQSNLFPPGFDISELSPYGLHRRRYGSKMVVIVEQTQISVIWACKVCLLIMYHRITRTALYGENIAIKILSVYVALGFIVMEVLYFTVWCRPVSEYWAVPTHSDQCNALINHRIVKAVFNLSSDVVILFIALQMLIRSLLPVKRKLILCGIFSLGIFVIIASVLNSYYSFKNPYQQTWVSWYVRESSTAILVANLPFTWAILRECFGVGSFDGSAPPPWTFHSAHTRNSIQGRRPTYPYSQSSRTVTTARPRPSPTNSLESNRSMKPIDSVSPFNHSPCAAVHSVQDSDTEKGVVDLEILRHDFAPVSQAGGAGVINIDLMQGHASDGYLCPVSPPPSYRSPLRKEDGSYVNDRPVSSSHAYLASRSSHSREASVGSADKRRQSSAPSDTSESALRQGTRAEEKLGQEEMDMIRACT